MRILLIDDSRSVHAFVTQVFSESSHELVHAYDGQQALDMLKADQNFNLILLDWEMPVLDGPSTLVKIKENGIDAPVVMVTTKGDILSIKSALEKGAADYVIKPFTKDILIGRVATVCGTEVA